VKSPENWAFRYQETTDLRLPSGGAIQFPGGSSPAGVQQLRGGLYRPLSLTEIAGNQNDTYNSNRETTAGHRLLGRNTGKHKPCFFQDLPKDRNDDRANRGLLQRASVFERKCLLVDAHSYSKARYRRSNTICRGAVLSSLQQIARVGHS